jgi:hypothetical protein
MPDYALGVDDKPDTLTRKELLTRRGYPEDVVNGNGHEPNVLPTPTDASAEPVPPEVRPCANCGQPLQKRQDRYCSRRCAAVAGGVAFARQKQAPPAPSQPPAVSPLAFVAQLPPEVVAIELVGGWRLSRSVDTPTAPGSAMVDLPPRR